MPKLAPIGSYGQNQALRAHVWAKNGLKTAQARPWQGVALLRRFGSWVPLMVVAAGLKLATGVWLALDVQGILTTTLCIALDIICTEYTGAHASECLQRLRLGLARGLHDRRGRPLAAVRERRAAQSGLMVLV
jgi:hypothetical protein